MLVVALRGWGSVVVADTGAEKRNKVIKSDTAIPRQYLLNLKLNFFAGCSRSVISFALPQGSLTLSLLESKVETLIIAMEVKIRQGSERSASLA
mmetsp:Transcript_11611/g.22853  ORF Transcript_11611/g.22853 Transcript_11611/m.22853 type:complete len:94 (-) Transcript_11611:342-623(-)